MTADRCPDDVKLSDLKADYSPETALAQNRVQVRPASLFRAAKLPSTFFDEAFRVRSNVDPVSIFEPFPLTHFALSRLKIGAPIASGWRLASDCGEIGRSSCRRRITS
jgi:hypothetical protein